MKAYRATNISISTENRISKCPTCAPITRGQGLKTKFSTWLAVGGSWDLDPDDFLLRGFFMDFFFSWGLDLADWSPPLP